jgi:hypothetical protein
MVTDEADAVLAILDQLAAGREPADSAWRRLFGSEGYRRLQQREAALRRAFTDSEFQAFVRSPDLVARAPVRATLARWAGWIRPPPPGRRSLPARHARIRASVYPVIKPRTNSFVLSPDQPAIFLYLDPAVPAPKFANTLAHELHHCVRQRLPRLRGQHGPPGIRAAIDWMGGFAEGRAVLAAAGAPDVHPHATSDSAERAVWDRDVALVPRDLARLEAFYFELLDGALSEEATRTTGFTFVATDSVPQGAFYTVGWYMATVVERELGRKQLVRTTCDPRGFLSDYDRAAARIMSRGGESLPRWSDSLLVRVGAEAP